MDSKYVFDKKRKNYVQLSELIREETYDDSWEHKNGFYQKTTKIKEEFSKTRYICDDVDSKDIILNYNIDRSQQGTGKSKKLKEKIEQAPPGVKYLVLFQEYLNLIEYDGVKNCVCMYPFKDTCEFIDELMPLYKNGRGISAYWVCKFKNNKSGVCENKESCKYIHQKKARKEPVSIAAIIQSAPAFNLDHYDEVFIEENTIGEKNIEWNKKKIVNELNKLYESYGTNIKNKEQEKKRELNQVIKKILDDTITYDDLKNISGDLEYAVNITNEGAVKTNSSKKFKERAFSIYIDDLMAFLKYRNVVGNYNKTSGIHKIDIPWTFLIFDMMVQYPDTKFTHLSASFPVEITKKHIKIWEEITPGYRIKLNVKNSHYKPHTCICYIHKKLRVTDDKFADMLPDVKNVMNSIKNKNRKRSVRGDKEYKDFVLTKKKHVKFKKDEDVKKDKDDDKDKMGTFAGSPAIHFGANHGINIFRDFHTLFVVGSNLPRVEDLKKHFNELYPRETEPDSYFPRIKEDRLSYYYKDPRLQMIYKEMYEDSERDSIHRLRPLISDLSYKYPKEIHFFGLIPSDLINHDGFTIKEVE